MNLLVIGGLLLVGLLALVGAFLLSMGEKSPMAKASSPPRQHVETPSEKQHMPEATQPSATGPNLPALTQEEHLPALDGQFYEMVSELRTLHRHASELEQRLSVLTILADSIEHSQSEHVSVEENSL